MMQSTKPLTIILLILASLMLFACEETPTNEESNNEEISGQDLPVVQEIKEIDLNETSTSEENKKPTDEKDEAEKKETTTQKKTAIDTEKLLAADFKDYPEILLSGKTPTYKVVVGMEGPPTDVIAAVDIVTSITAEIGENSQSGLSVMDAQVSRLDDNNYIIIGSPCWNKKAAETLGLTYPACSETSITGPELRIVKQGNYHTILVLGKTAEDIEQAAKALALNNNLKGSTIKIN